MRFSECRGCDDCARFSPSSPPPPPPASQPLPDYAYGEGDEESDDDGLPLVELRAEADTQDLAASNVTLDGFVEAIEASATVFGDEPVKVQVSQVDVMFYGVEGEEVIDRQDRQTRTQTPLSRIVTPPPRLGGQRGIREGCPRKQGVPPRSSVRGHLDQQYRCGNPSSRLPSHSSHRKAHVLHLATWERLV